MSNLKLWDSVSKTDPTFTKKVTQRGGYTSISPQYQLREATNVFGSYGVGFGFESIEFDYELAESTKLVLVKAVFFYVLDGKKITFPIMNSWSFMQGSKVDADFAKKAETNTMSKALSKLGFSADVFMGQFDDPEYVGMVGNEFALEKADDKSEELARQQLAYRDECMKQINALKDAKTPSELKGLFGDFIRRATTRNDVAHIARLNKARDEKLKTTEVKK